MGTILVRLEPWLCKKNPASWVVLAGLLTCLGCAQIRPANEVLGTIPPVASLNTSPNSIHLAQHKVLPPPPSVASLGVPMDSGSNVVPIDLDTILRLAHDQNGQIQLAREQLNEADANQALADKGWLPEIDVGVSYYRHEGGIQDVDGKFFHSSYGSLFAGAEIHGRLDLREIAFKKIDAERKTWQQRGEVSRLSSESLLDAANTYFDLLTAKNGEAISLATEEKIRKVLERAKNLAATEPGMKVEVYRVQSQLAAQQQITREVQAGARSAAAKLVHLLNLNPQTQLAVMDQKLVPFPKIAPNTPAQALVTLALSQGPGIHELEGLLDLIQRADAEANGPGKYLPVFEVRVAEGGFGAGPGDSATWDNRLDVCLQAKWNISSLCTARERQWAVQSKMHQAHLSHQNLRSRLTLGVQEAVEASASNAEQMPLAQKQIEDAREAYKLSESRLINNIPGSSPSEVLLAARGLAAAQLSYLTTIRDYDKAQVRLLILTGQGPNCAHH